ncbi:hypothetical protein Goshw_002623 [Gossypium schwendimanii]|uniref:Uncharacterized protein n=1 Tax=Gossypium schwendimanii TaxID=34291 RepID=A0A7J9L7I6_GOSSC|nr:hypothetical protein [Gossypium schwendimanii]
MSNQVKLVKIDHKTCFKSLSSSNEGEEGGYVIRVVTYMVMDDLIVKPLSTISSLGLLNRFSVKDSGALQEKTIKIRCEIAQGIVAVKTVLNDIFYGKKAHV